MASSGVSSPFMGGIAPPPQEEDALSGVMGLFPRCYGDAQALQALKMRYCQCFAGVMVHSGKMPCLLDIAAPDSCRADKERAVSYIRGRCAQSSSLENRNPIGESFMWGHHMEGKAKDMLVLLFGATILSGGPFVLRDDPRFCGTSDGRLLDFIRGERLVNLEVKTPWTNKVPQDGVMIGCLVQSYGEMATSGLKHTVVLVWSPSGCWGLWLLRWEEAVWRDIMLPQLSHIIDCCAAGMAEPSPRREYEPRVLQGRLSANLSLIARLPSPGADIVWGKDRELLVRQPSLRSPYFSSKASNKASSARDVVQSHQDMRRAGSFVRSFKRKREGRESGRTSQEQIAKRIKDITTPRQARATDGSSKRR